MISITKFAFLALIAAVVYSMLAMAQPSQQRGKGDRTVSVQDSERYLRSNVLKSIEQYEVQLYKCENIKKRTIPPKLDNSIIMKLKFNKKELLSSLIYLNKLNQEKCSVAERNQFAFDYIMYINFLKQHDIAASSVKYPPFKNEKLNLEFDSAQSIIKLTEYAFGTKPFMGSISIELNYLSMSEAKRKYLEDQIGDKMFGAYRLYSQLYK